MITVVKSLNITGLSNLWKLDQNLNILIQYNSTTPAYRGLFFHSTNSLLYVAPSALTVIHVFNLNLIYNHSFSTSSKKPFSIKGYNNQICKFNTGRIKSY